MSKIYKRKFELVDAVEGFQSSCSNLTVVTDWNACFLCQRQGGVLDCPGEKSTHADKKSGYKTLSENLKKFEKENALGKNTYILITVFISLYRFM